MWLLTIRSIAHNETDDRPVRRACGSLAGFLFPLHACLFQLSLLADMVELKLKLPLPLIIQERRPSTPSHSFFPCCMDHHRGKDGTDCDAKDEFSHRGFCCAPFYLETSNYHAKVSREEGPLLTGVASGNRCIVIDPTTDTIGLFFKTSFSKALWRLP